MQTAWYYILPVTFQRFSKNQPAEHKKADYRPASVKNTQQTTIDRARETDGDNHE